MRKPMLAACVASALLIAGGAHAKKVKGDGIPSAPAAAERAQLIKSGATRAPNAWSAYIVRLADKPVARYRGGI
ncbi:MAG: hypothetical protein KJO54_11225, partial [Gammaproteobacteria bacterium]|nr:hypothetical protein [Gammaproteobacteria bacterium]NNF61701.1 hypothetical protein [Gammaproteobacteria bacterium]